jgi:PAS domain S-box-containing protein
MDLLPQGVIICDRGGHITTLNDSVVRIWGISRGDLEGQTLGDVTRRLAPENGNGVAISIRNMPLSRALRTGNPAMNIPAFIQVNGSQRELNISAMPVRDAAGNVAGCLATVKDIAVMKSIVRPSQMALNVSNADDLIEESPDLIVNAMGLRLASLYLWDGSELKLNRLKGEYAGMPVPECRDLPDPLSPTLPSRVYLSGKPLLVKDYRRCASIHLFDPLARRRPIRSMAGVPLLADNEVIGVLVAATGEGHSLDEAQLAELSALCSQMAAGIDQS